LVSSSTGWLVEEVLLEVLVVVVLLDFVLVDVVVDFVLPGVEVLPGIFGGVVGVFSDGDFALGVCVGVVTGGGVVVVAVVVVVVVVGVCATGTGGLVGVPCCSAA
jgi:hypothetical protein